METKNQAPAYTDEQVTKVMEAQKVDRIRAIHLIKRLGVEKALVPALKPAKPAKPTRKVNKAKEPFVPKYDRDKIIALWEKGKTPVEIQTSDAPGVKGISAPYVVRVLFGSKNSGGVSAEQAKRHKVELQRRADAKKSREAKDKAAK
jgi:hypothetical protein